MDESTPSDGRHPAATAASLVVPALVVMIVTAILVGLGVWQLQRRAFKHALIERVESRATLAPADLPPPETWDSLDIDQVDYMPVRVSGRFRHAAEVHVYTSLSAPKGPLGGPGFFIYTPLERDDGTFVFINRGFVPVRHKNPLTRVAGQVAGPVTLEGLVRRPQRRSWLAPADDLTQNVWFTRDADAMALARGLPDARVAPFTIDAAASATPPGGLPQAGETPITFSDNHLQYALTWFGLAAACLAVFAAVVRARLRRPAEAEPPGSLVPPAGA